MTALVSQPSIQVTYAARRENLRLTKRRRFPVRNPVTGEVEGMSPGEYVGFRYGLFSCPPAGKFKLVDTLDGGEAEIDAADLVKWLDNHRLNGDLQEGFWKVEQAAPPLTAGESDAISEATFNLELEVLNQMLKDEMAGWKRPDVIGIIEKGIGRAETLHAEIERRSAVEAKPTPKAK